jgi:hypothetical protein
LRIENARSGRSGADRRLRRVGKMVAVFAGLLVAFVMLCPIGGDTRYAQAPDGTGIDVFHYWSIGTALLSFVSSNSPWAFANDLNVVTVPLGLVSSAVTSYYTYLGALRLTQWRRTKRSSSAGT